ncbi:DUF2160 domain-containing protein [Parasphingorhabdus sp.]|uniref:DUF2160 domain-containing protein n=1 Tax=Parasphingorhabdus sp. TaxID=2709688 RepID=UPI0007F48B82|nr:hypothetical protein A8B75_05980 [Sphingomonadales bacterium EhC05]
MEWMAWTLPTALFFLAIAVTLIGMGLLHMQYPSTPRIGILGIETMRGDRLFISLLGSAFINLAWIGLLDVPQYGALIICGLFAFCVFRWV